MIILPFPYNSEKGVHNMIGLVLDGDNYRYRYQYKFPMPNKWAVCDDTIPTNATNVVQSKSKAVHTVKIADYLLFAAAESKIRDFILAVIEDTWVRKLREPVTFYTSVSLSDLLAYLKTLWGSLHALDVLSMQNKIHN